MPDWFGAIGSYVVLMGMAEVPSLEGLAVALAWAIAIGVGYMLIASGTPILSRFGGTSGTPQQGNTTQPLPTV